MIREAGLIFKSLVLNITTPNTHIHFRTSDSQAYKVAKLDDILKCESIEEIKNLKDNKSKYYRARNFIPIAPFLIYPIYSAISVYQGNVDRVLLDVINSIKRFDLPHEDDNEYKEKAAIKYKPLLLWLYIAIQTVEIEGVYKVQAESSSNVELTNLLKRLNQIT